MCVLQGYEIDNCLTNICRCCTEMCLFCPKCGFFCPQTPEIPPSKGKFPVKSAFAVKKAVAHGQQPRPLSQSLAALTALPKGEPLAVHTNFISMPRPLPLRKDFPRAGGRCRAATKGGVWRGVSRDGEGEDAKVKTFTVTTTPIKKLPKSPQTFRERKLK